MFINATAPEKSCGCLHYMGFPCTVRRRRIRRGLLPLNPQIPKSLAKHGCLLQDLRVADRQGSGAVLSILSYFDAM